MEEIEIRINIPEEKDDDSKVIKRDLEKTHVYWNLSTFESVLCHINRGAVEFTKAWDLDRYEHYEEEDIPDDLNQRAYAIFTGTDLSNKLNIRFFYHYVAYLALIGQVAGAKGYVEGGYTVHRELRDEKAEGKWVAWDHLIIDCSHSDIEAEEIGTLLKKLENLRVYVSYKITEDPRKFIIQYEGKVEKDERDLILRLVSAYFDCINYRRLKDHGYIAVIPCTKPEEVEDKAEEQLKL